MISLNERLKIERVGKSVGCNDEVLVYRLGRVEQVGKMTLSRLSLPQIDEIIYYLNKLYIAPEHRNKGYGGQAVDWLSQLIISEAGIGVLLNRVEVEGAVNIYQHRGWMPFYSRRDCWEYLSRRQSEKKELDLITGEISCRIHDWYCRLADLVIY